MRLWILASAIALAVTGCTKEEPASAKSPTGFFEDSQAAVAEGKPQQFWRTLPASYQNDVKGLLTEASTKVDAELYGKAMQVASKVGQVLGTKTDMLMEAMGPMVASMPDEEKATIKKGMSSLASVLGTIATDYMAESSALTDLDIDGMLTDVGKDLEPILEVAAKQMTMEDDPMAKVKKATFTVISEEGDTAKVKVETEGEKPEEVDMVKVDGRWLPKDMVDSWSEMIAEAKASIANMEMSAAAVGKAKLQLGSVEAMVDQILAAKSADELSGMMPMIMGMMGGMGGGMGGGMPPGGMPGGMPERVAPGMPTSMPK